MMHALGVFHEHTRPDRDRYVTIHYQNMQLVNFGNFVKRSSLQVKLPRSRWDWYSIMLYEPNAFSRNGRNTISAKNGKRMLMNYEKPVISDGDIELLKNLYKCA